MNPTRLHAIMSGDARDLRARLARVAMSCAEPFYRAAVGVRNAMFDWGIRKPKKLPRPVISVGNITTGGTGKTPMVIEIARRLLEMGAKPAILTRGYKGKMDGSDRTSDEVEVFRRTLGDSVPVEADADRVAGAAKLLLRVPDIDVFLLDDGFQHRQVKRDVNIALIDATAPFGFHRLLPRGLLREPIKNLRRADFIVITRANEIEERKVNHILAFLSQGDGLSASVFLLFEAVFQLRNGRCIQGVRATQMWTHLLESPAPKAIDVIRDCPVFAFTGIGNPAAFEKMLRRYAPDVRGFHAFPDHHAYTTDDLRSVIADAQAAGAQAIITTEKDWVKAAPLLDWTQQPIPVYRPVLRIEFPNEAEWQAIEKRLRECLRSAAT
jgi:tetraacyldisaccharide 4'-kinase